MSNQLLENTYAVMVHRPYQKRVQEYLLTKGHFSLDQDASVPDASELETQILDSQVLKGTSKSRRGYVLLLLPGCRDSRVWKLAPMARKNISWMCRISHWTTLLSQPSEKEPHHDEDNVLGETLLTALQKQEFQVDTHLLRIEVHPRQQVDRVCRSLQKAAGCEGDTPDDAFAGPIELTKSRTRCTHRLTVILKPFDDNNDDNDRTRTRTKMYWGIDQRSDNLHNKQPIDFALNDQASKEILIEACDSRNGQEYQDRVVQAQIPLSRAYYKLDQVYHEYLAQHKSTWDQGMGLDLGASPGGWTQVLVHSLGLSSVVSVDAAALARRVTDLAQVKHWKQRMEVACEDPLFPKGPYSMVVCDACMLWMELLDLLKSKVVSNIQCTLPAVWVLTMKLPFKNEGSVQRHVSQLEEMLDSYFAETVGLLYPQQQNVRWTLKLVHLMANSESERTLLVTFYEDQQ